jgi:hypothetical protein
MGFSDFEKRNRLVLIEGVEAASRGRYVGMQSWTLLQISDLQQGDCRADKLVLGEAARIASHLQLYVRKSDADLRVKGQAHGDIC